MTSITDSLVVAFGIMAMGMIMVFLFLGVLIGGVNLVAARFGPKTAQVAADNNTDTQVDPKVLAAITAAIHQYRTKA